MEEGHPQIRSSTRLRSPLLSSFLGCERLIHVIALSLEPSGKAGEYMENAHPHNCKAWAN